MAVNNHLIEAVVRGQAGSQAVVNVLHYRLEATGIDADVQPSSDELADFLSSFRDLWVTEFLPLLSDIYRVEQYEAGAFKLVTIKTGATVYTPLFVQQALNVPAPADPGEVAGDNLPYFNAVSARKVTGFGGRNWRGGLRFSVIPEASNVNGQLTSAAFTAWTAAVDTLLNDITVAVGNAWVCNLVVYSSKLHAAATVADPTAVANAYARLVTAVAPKETVSSQLSRKPPFLGS